jgi:Ser/Thr protein kinase RdoA (MazF antagonist)
LTQAPYYPHIPRPGRIIAHVKARMRGPGINLDTVQEILTQYGLGLVARPHTIAGTWRHQNVVLESTGGRWVLKLYRETWPADAIGHEHSILLRLEQLAFPAPRLAVKVEGATSVSVGDKIYALYSYAEGINYAASYMARSHYLELLTVAARLLARLHYQLAGFEPRGDHHLGYKAYTGDRRRDLAWHIDRLHQLPTLSQHLNDPNEAQDAIWLIERRQELEDQLLETEQLLSEAQLLRLIIHGDYGLHNLLVNRNGTVTVLDFELARLEWRLSDLIVVMSRLDLEASRHFIATYHAEYPLSADEWHFFPRVWQMRKLQSAIQYWHNYFELGGGNRLAKARSQVNQAQWLTDNLDNFADLKQS